MPHSEDPALDTTAEAYLQAFIARRRRQDEEKAKGLAILNQMRERSRDVHLELLEKAGISKQDYFDLLQSNLAQPLADLQRERLSSLKGGGRPSGASPPAPGGLPSRMKPVRPQRRAPVALDEKCQTSQIPATGAFRYYALPGRDAQPPAGYYWFDKAYSGPGWQPGDYPYVQAASETLGGRPLVAQPVHLPTFAGFIYSYTPPSDGYLTVTATPEIWWGYGYSYPFDFFADADLQLGAYLEIGQNKKDLTAGAGEVAFGNEQQFNHYELNYGRSWETFEFQQTIPVTPAAGPVFINLGVRAYSQSSGTGFADGLVALYNSAPIALQLCGFELF